MRRGNKQNAGLNREWGSKVKGFYKLLTSKKRRIVRKAVTKKEMRDDREEG